MGFAPNSQGPLKNMAMTLAIISDENAPLIASVATTIVSSHQFYRVLRGRGRMFNDVVLISEMNTPTDPSQVTSSSQAGMDNLEVGLVRSPQPA
jgi:hypothetical protein